MKTNESQIKKRIKEEIIDHLELEMMINHRDADIFIDVGFRFGEKILERLNDLDYFRDAIFEEINK